MKILTIRQPFIQFITLGVKRYETRSWSTAYRGPVVLLAGKSREHIVDGRTYGEWTTWRRNPVDWLDRKGVHEVTGDEIELPLGVVVAVADIVDCLPILTPDERLDEAWKPHIAPARNYGEICHWKGRTTHDGPMGRPTWVIESIDDQLPYGMWEPGNWAWQLDNVRPLDEPIPWKGTLGLRDAPDVLLDLIGAQIEVTS